MTQQQIQRRRFGRTDLEVSPVGFGGAEIGVLELGQEHATELLNHLLDLGINVIDTAAMYRVSEELIGNAIGHRRDEYVLISKCGTEVDDVKAAKWSPELVGQTVDRALRRLTSLFGSQINRFKSIHLTGTNANGCLTFNHDNRVGLNVSRYLPCKG